MERVARRLCLASISRASQRRHLECERLRLLGPIGIVLRIVGQQTHGTAVLVGQFLQLGPLLRQRGSARLIVELFNRSHQVFPVLRENRPNREASFPHDHDVGASVGQRLRGADASHRAKGADRGRDARGDSKSLIAGQAVGQHLPVAWLEDVQRQRFAGEEDQIEGEEGQTRRHGLNNRASAASHQPSDPGISRQGQSSG